MKPVRWWRLVRTMFCAWIDARALGVSFGCLKSATPVCPVVLIVVFKVSSFSPVAQKMWCVEMVQQHCLWSIVAVPLGAVPVFCVHGFTKMYRRGISRVVLTGWPASEIQEEKITFNEELESRSSEENYKHLCKKEETGV